MKELVLQETVKFDFSVGDLLAAYMWDHMKDKECKQISKKDNHIQYEIITELPPIVQAAFGKSISMVENANITNDGFVSETTGVMPGCSFTANMNFWGDNSTSSSVKMEIGLIWNDGVSDFVKQPTKSFIVSKVRNWSKSLPKSFNEYKQNKE